jgi:hypothetical protein
LETIHIQNESRKNQESRRVREEYAPAGQDPQEAQIHRIARQSIDAGTTSADEESGFICVPARHSPAGGAQAPYRPGVCLRQPHWQLVCSQRQAFAWHPQAQDEQSQVPQQLVLAIFCAVVFFISAMVGLL